MRILVKDPKVRISKKLKPYLLNEYLSHGLIILDKPAGPKSKHVTNKIKNLLKVVRTGHAGTLDPKVTGILPVGLGKATKILGLLSNYPKTYEGEMKLHGDVSKVQLEKAFKKFTGKIRQLPPKISAVKRAYRIREIYSFDILRIEGRLVSYKVHCQAGTYIRKLCHDVGEYLGTGAHMTKLRRTKSGPFTLKDTTTINSIIKNKEVASKFAKPVEIITKHMSRVWVDNDAVPRIIQGSPVFAPGVAQLTDDIEKGTVTAILDQENRLVAIGPASMSSKKILKSKKGMAIKTDAVLLSVK